VKKKSVKLTPGILESANPWLWAYNRKIQLVPGPFILKGHEYQVRAMTAEAPVLVFKKATQMTITESQVLRVLHAMIHGMYPQGCLYLFPTQDEVTDFSASRFSPLLKDNPGAIGCHVTDTNRIALKRIGSGYLYFRAGRLGQSIQGSMKTSSKLKAIPVDHAVFDEWDEMDPKIDEFVDGRMQHSLVKTKAYLANPTLPDFGIDSKYQESNQEQWHIKCKACGSWTCLDEEGAFPECLKEQKDGAVIRACKKCGKEINPRHGEWVAGKPSLTKDIIGQHISHFNSTYVNPAAILRKFRNPNTNLADLYRLILGLAYIEAENRLSVQEVLALCGNEGIESACADSCFMGVDQGKDLHVVIGSRHVELKGQIRHIGVYKDWEELDRLMRNFHIICCVVDALPETRNARAFAKRFPGQVFLNYYNEHQKGSYAWNEKEYIVSCNRTESLDASHKQVSEGHICLPKRCEIVEEFAKHLHNVAKKLEEDEETGSKRYVYVRLGPDHFRHAFNYETMARQKSEGLLFPTYH